MRRQFQAKHPQAVLVHVSGTDPKQQKAKSSSFFRSTDGITTISCSGMLVSSSNDDLTRPLVLVPTSFLFPFLSASSKLSVGSQAEASSDCNLTFLEGTRLEVRIPFTKQGIVSTAHLLQIREIPGLGESLAALVNSHSSAGLHGWSVGWLLGRAQPNFPTLAHIAVLELVDFPVAPQVEFGACCSSLEMGESLVAVGSPFGVLSPLHFFNSVTTGCCSNYWPSAAQDEQAVVASLDMRVLPGMEGGPVLNSRGELAGMLWLPLSLESSNIEIPLMVTSSALASALPGISLHCRFTPNTSSSITPSISPFESSSRAPSSGTSGPPLSADPHPSPPVRRPSGTAAPPPAEAGSAPKRRPSPLSSSFSRLGGAVEGSLSGDAVRGVPTKGEVMGGLCGGQLSDGLTRAVAAARPSVVAVALGRQTWASGVVVNDSGLIVTNAHLFHPEGVTPQQGSQQGFPSISPTPGSLRVRLEGLQTKEGSGVSEDWVDASVLYVFKNGWDIAVLQLAGVPAGGYPAPLRLSEAEPQAGAPVAVIGHATFSPFNVFAPSVSTGVLASVVRADVAAPLAAAAAEPGPGGLVAGMRSAAVRAGSTARTGGRVPAFGGRAGGTALTVASLRSAAPLPPTATRPGDGGGASAGGPPVMLLSTATVHSGASGGALIDRTGALAGLVTSNAKHSRTGRTIPNLNFSIPTSVPLWEVLQQRDVTPAQLANLDVADEAVSRIWALASWPPAVPVVTGQQRLAKLLRGAGIDSSLIGQDKGGQFGSGLQSRL